MGRSQETFGKKEKEKKKLKKRQEKQAKKEARKANSNKGAGLEDMLAYVDENGQLTDTPPDQTKKVKIDPESIEIGVPKKEYVEPEPLKGKVAFFNHDKGYGFINETGSRDRYFVHANGLMQPIEENDTVTFDVEQGPKGLMAVRVQKI